MASSVAQKGLIMVPIENPFLTQRAVESAMTLAKQRLIIADSNHAKEISKSLHLACNATFNCCARAEKPTETNGNETLRGFRFCSGFFYHRKILQSVKRDVT
jgi:hypothetical protein